MSRFGAFLEQLKSGFSRTFWVANVIELFERFAYYGSKAILTVYVAEKVGLGPERAAWLVGSLFNTLLYFLPLLAGTIVDRYGFKRSLMACFAIFCCGYFLIGLGGLPAGKGIVTALGGPTTSRRASAWRSVRPSTMRVSRRGVPSVRTAVNASRCSASRRPAIVFRSSSADGR